jgi:hypothetical protein
MADPGGQAAHSNHIKQVNTSSPAFSAGEEGDPTQLGEVRGNGLGIGGETRVPSSPRCVPQRVPSSPAKGAGEDAEASEARMMAAVRS